MGMRELAGNREFSNISRDTRRSRYESSGVGAAEDEEVRGCRRGRAATIVHGVAVVGGGMVAAGSVTVAAGAATGAAAKVTEAAGRCDSVRVATEVAVYGGTWAECSYRSGAGGTAAAGAATGAAAEVTAAAAVGSGSARCATEVAVVVGSKSCCRSDTGRAEVRGGSGESGSWTLPVSAATRSACAR